MPLHLIIILTTINFITQKGCRILLTLYATNLGAGPLETGVMFALYGLFPFLLAVMAGRLADRFDNRLLMYWGLSTYTISLAIPFFLPNLSTLYWVAPIWSVTSMLWVVATQNLIGIISTKETRTQNFSFYSLGESLASIAGPIIVGVSIDYWSHLPTFLVLAAIPGLCTAIILFNRQRLPTPKIKPSVENHKQQLMDLLRLPAMRNALLTNAVVMAGLDLFNLYMPIYGHSLHFSATTIGLVMGAFGAAAFVTRTALPTLTKCWTEKTVLMGALAISGCVFIAIPFTASAPWLAFSAFLLGLGLGCGQPLSMVLAFNAGPPGRSAEALSVRLAVSYGAHVVVPPMFGVIGSLLGMAPIFWTCAVVMGSGAYLNYQPKNPPMQ